MWDTANQLVSAVWSWGYTAIYVLIVGLLLVTLIVGIGFSAYVIITDIVDYIKHNMRIDWKFNLSEGFSFFASGIHGAWIMFVLANIILIVLSAFIYIGSILLLTGNFLLEHWDENRADAPFAIALVVGFGMMFLYKHHKLIAGVGAALFLTAASHWIGEIVFPK